jgi:hypothetical protein
MAKPKKPVANTCTPSASYARRSRLPAVLMYTDQVRAVPVVVNENRRSVPVTPAAGTVTNRRLKITPVLVYAGSRALVTPKL